MGSGSKEDSKKGGFMERLVMAFGAYLFGGLDCFFGMHMAVDSEISSARELSHDISLIDKHLLGVSNWPTLQRRANSLTG